jgi:myosin heavy subunit
MALVDKDLDLLESLISDLGIYFASFSNSNTTNLLSSTTDPIDWAHYSQSDPIGFLRTLKDRFGELAQLWCCNNTLNDLNSQGATRIVSNIPKFEIETRVKVAISDLIRSAQLSAQVADKQEQHLKSQVKVVTDLTDVAVKLSPLKDCSKELGSQVDDMTSIISSFKREVESLQTNLLNLTSIENRCDKVSNRLTDYETMYSDLLVLLGKYNNLLNKMETAKHDFHSEWVMSVRDINQSILDVKQYIASSTDTWLRQAIESNDAKLGLSQQLLSVDEMLSKITTEIDSFLKQSTELAGISETLLECREVYASVAAHTPELIRLNELLSEKSQCEKDHVVNERIGLALDAINVGLTASKGVLSKPGVTL